MFVLYVKDVKGEAGRFATGLEAEQAMPEIAAEVAAATGLNLDEIKFEIVEDLDDADAEAVEALAGAKAHLDETLKSLRRSQWDAKMTVERAEARAKAITAEIERLMREQAEIEQRLPAMRAERDETLATLTKRERAVRSMIERAKAVESAAANLRYGRKPAKAWRAKRDGRIIVDGKDLPDHAASLQLRAALHTGNPAV